MCRFAKYLWDFLNIIDSHCSCCLDLVHKSFNKGKIKTNYCENFQSNIFGVYLNWRCRSDKSLRITGDFKYYFILFEFKVLILQFKI